MIPSIVTHDPKLLKSDKTQGLQLNKEFDTSTAQLVQHSICLQAKHEQLCLGDQTQKSDTEDSPEPLYVKHTLYGYSKPMFCNAWHNTKDVKLIRLSLAEKTFKSCRKFSKIKLCSFQPFWTFSQPRMIGSIFPSFALCEASQPASLECPQINGSGLSSGKFKIQIQAVNLNLFVCVRSSKPNHTFLVRR